MAAPYATPAATPRAPLGSINGSRSQSFGVAIKLGPSIVATPAPQASAEAFGSASRSASRKSFGAVPSSIATQPPSTMIRNRLAVMPPQSLNSSVAPTPMPAASRLSLAPTPGQSQANNRKSFGAAMMSAPKDPSRRSSVFPGNNGARGKTDTRPKDDKAWQQRAVQKLLSFLVEHNWNGAPISPKTLQGITSKDFVNIILFIYRLHDENYTIEGKVEEEIPALFRTLKYPFAISKSSMQSIGAPHTWSHHLAALDWLVDWAVLGEKQFSSNGSNSLVEGEQDDTLFDYIGRAYECYLKGTDEYLAIDNDMAQSQQRRSEELRAHIEEIKKEINSISRDIDHLKEQGASLPRLQKLISNQHQDIIKFQKHVSDLEVYERTVMAKSEDAKKEVANRITERETLQRERESYSKIVKEQEMNNIDGEKLTKERTQLEEALKQAGASKDVAEKHSWEAEMALSKQLAELEGIVKSYNAIATRLSLIPITAKHSRGKSFEVPFNSSRAHINEHIINQIRNEIIPALAELKAKTSTKLVTAREASISLQESVDATEEMIAEKFEEVAQLESSVSKSKDVYEADKVATNEKLVIIANDTQALVAESAKFRTGLSAARVRAQKTYEMMQAEYDALLKRHNQETDEFNTHVLGAIHVLMNHKFYTHEALEAIKIYYASTHQTLLNS